MAAFASKVRFFPHLWFDQDAAKAAELYTKLFPDSAIQSKSSFGADAPGGPPGGVTVVDFTIMGQRMRAMSTARHEPFTDAISMVVLCQDQAELDRYWSGLLADGGREQACGWLVDRFGLRWQIIPAMLEEAMGGSDPARSNRVLEALWKMVKIDIATLQKAAAGSG